MLNLRTVEDGCLVGVCGGLGCLHHNLRQRTASLGSYGRWGALQNVSRGVESSTSDALALDIQVMIILFGGALASWNPSATVLGDRWDTSVS